MSLLILTMPVESAKTVYRYINDNKYAVIEVKFATSAKLRPNSGSVYALILYTTARAEKFN